MLASTPPVDARPRRVRLASLTCALSTLLSLLGCEPAKVDDSPASSSPPAAQVGEAEPSGWDLCGRLARRAGTPLPTGPGVTWASLLCEVADLDRFVRGPAPYTVRMASSRDPASKVEGQEGWYANEDSGHFLRDEGDEHVLLEAEGPGAITRIWSANPTGVLHLYIDDRTQPALEIELARLLRGTGPEPFRAPFSYVSGKGSNLIFPIPHAKYLKVTVSGSQPKLFYQVDHRSYPAGTVVESYSNQGAAALAPLAREVRWVLENPEEVQDLVPLAEATLLVDDAQPEQTATLGPAVIRELIVSGFTPTAEWLRTTRLIMTVDGERAVDAPIGSLFTADLGISPHKSLAASVSREALVLRWPIPVKGQVAVRVESNRGSVGQLRFFLRSSAGLPAEPLRFHAQWTGARTFDTRAPADWTLAHLRGKGYYVGSVLNVANPVIEWWGEGDEKVFVDGAASPSLFGTGTEDYFGYAWCANHVFATPFNGQPRFDGALNWGRASMYRWHVLEAIPFTTELRFNLEVQHWRTGAQAVQLSEDALAIWYATPDTRAEPRPLALSDFVLPSIETERPFWLLPYDCEFLSLLP